MGVRMILNGFTDVSRKTERGVIGRSTIWDLPTETRANDPVWPDRTSISGVGIANNESVGRRLTNLLRTEGRGIPRRIVVIPTVFPLSRR